MNIYKVILLNLLFCFQLSAQNKNKLCIAFYNQENLFDTIDTPNKNDDEFLPQGTYKWNTVKYQNKLANMSKVITSMNGGNGPDFLGLCEVENDIALKDLSMELKKNKLEYEIVWFDSPDERGIDNALLFQKNAGKLIKSVMYKIDTNGIGGDNTRGILLADFLLSNKSRIIILVNHWPSRSGGQAETEEKRIFAAKTARRVCDSIQNAEPNANIILVGDFNDYPTDKSIVEFLGAEGDSTKKASRLYNLMTWQNSNQKGSHQYKGEWGFLDQVIVSSALVNGNGNLKTYFKSAQVFKPDFVLEKNEKYGTIQPFRTYGGKKYLGGYSDHMPVFVDIYAK